MDDDDLTRRAFAAYFRNADGPLVAQPSNCNGVETVDGLNYVVLNNVNGILAVYRVRTDGALKRLRRWPSALSAS